MIGASSIAQAIRRNALRTTPHGMDIETTASVLCRKKEQDMAALRVNRATPHGDTFARSGKRNARKLESAAFREKQRALTIIVDRCNALRIAHRQRPRHVFMRAENRWQAGLRARQS